MARTKGSYSLSANIEINAAAPLDARERVATLADLTAEGSFPYHYVGMETYVVATGKKYRLTGSDPTVSANWSEIGEGGSGSGGHTIEDSTGTDMSSRSNLQFKGAASVSDDSGNDRTVVEVPIMSSSDMSEIISPLPTPAEPDDLDDLGDVTITTPTNGQVLKYDSESSKWVNANESGGGGGTGGHVIEDSTGTDMTARANLQFTGVAAVSDDLTNNRTIVDVPAMPSSDMSEIISPLPTPSTGTTVVPNPSEPATASLTKLQVGETVYGISDESSNEYSTIETRIGTWIDGKDLYRRVFSFPGAANVAANTWTSVLTISLPNLDNIIRSTVISNDSDKPAELNYVTAMYFKNDGAFKVLHTRSVALNFVDPTYIICEYTKTSS